MGQVLRNLVGNGRIRAGLLAAALASLPARAHLEPGSLSSPAAGAGYAAGSALRITWIQSQHHSGNYALAWSRNTGATWEPIASWAGPAGDGAVVNYGWTVPDAPGAKARVRVCQIGECGDPDYFLISGDFGILPASAVRPGADAPGRATLEVRNGSVEAAFTLDRPADATLEARDATGGLLDILLAGRFGTGSHRLTVEAGRHPAGTLLRLRVGHHTVAWARATLP